MAITAAELMVTIGADTSGAQAGVRSFSDQLNSASRTMGAAGMALSAGVTAPILGIGASSLMAAANFESGMNRVAALSGATGDDLTALTNQAKELGATTRFSATQAADAMGFLAMAGFKTNDILGAMPSTLQLAAAAQLDLGRAADITSNIMTGYGLTVDDLGRVNDVLVASFTNANTDLSMLGEAMKYAGPVASGMGMSFEEAAAAIAMMGNAGIQGSMAGTALRGALVQLSNPSKEQTKIMESLGLSVFDTTGAMRPFADILEQLEVSGADASTVMALFGQRAGPAMLALLDQGSDGLRDFTAMLERSGGSAKRVADVQMQGLNGALTELKSAWEGVQIAFMDMGGLDLATGAIKSMIQWVRDGYTAWTELDPAVRNAILAFGAVFVAAGPVLLALSGITAALAFVLSPIGFLVVASAALAAAWVSDFGGMRTAVTEWWNGVQPAFGEWRKWAESVLPAAVETFQRRTIAAWNAIASRVTAGWNEIKSRTTQTWAAIQPTLVEWAMWMQTALPQAWETMRSVAVSVWDTVSAKAVAAWGIIAPTLIQWWAWAQVAIPAAWNTLKEAATAAWDAVSTRTTEVWSQISPTLTSWKEWLGDTIPAAWNTLKEAATTAWDNISEAISPALERLNDAFSTMMERLAELSFGDLQTALTELMDAGAPAINAIKEAWDALIDVFGPSIERIQESFDVMVAKFGDMNTGGTELGAAFGRLGEALLPIVVLIGGALVVAVTFAINALSAVLTYLPDAIEIVVAKITNTVNTIADILAAATALVLAVIEGDWDAAWESLRTIVVTAVAGVLTSLQLAGELFGIVLLALKDAVVNTLADFGVDVKDPFDAVEASVREFWAWLTGLSWDDVWTGLGNGFAGMIDTMVNWEWPSLQQLTGWGWPTLPTWSWPSFPTWTWPSFPTWTWPSLPRWTWPEIPTPEWVRRLLGWAGVDNNAAGSTNFGGGLTWVGERGPELVALPGGSRIYNNQESMAMAGSSGVTIGEVHIHNDMDVEALINRLARRLDRRMR